MITFNAKPINPATIKKRSLARSTYQDYPVTFVEFLPESKNDLKTLDSVAKKWKSNADFARYILNDFSINSANNLDNFKYFGLINLLEGFNNIMCNKVLGIMEINQDPETFYINRYSDYFQEYPQKPIVIEYIETSPLYKHKKSNILKLYQDIGTAMISSIRTLYPNSDIMLTASQKAEKFYEKLEFEPIGFQIYTLRTNKK